MTVEIVDEFEAVEIHEDESEGTAGAGRALPLGRKRFHEEAMGFDIGEAVSDGLLLRLLEGEGVVKSAGNQIGEGVEKESIFLGNFYQLHGFDVQDAVQVFGIKDRKSHCREGLRENRLGESLIVGRGAEGSGLTGTSDLSDEARIEWKPTADRAATGSAFGVDYNSRVV